MKIFPIVASVVVLIFGVVSPVHADCAGPIPPAENLQQSDVVFSGEVITVEPTTMEVKAPPGMEEDLEFSMGGDSVTFQVLEAWKGVETPTVTLYAPNHSEGYTFEQGQRYLVYAYYGVMEFQSAPLTTNGCKGNKPLAEAEEDVKALRDPGYQPDPGTEGSGEAPATSGPVPGSQPPPGITITDLNTLGAIDGTTRDINEHGQIVGHMITPRGEAHVFVWQDGVMTDLGTLGSDFSTATAINERGQIIGEMSSPAGESRSYLWQDGVMTDLGTLGGATVASAINDEGQIVGASQTSSGEMHAFVWQDGVMTDLGTLGGRISLTSDMNEQGQIVGGSETPVGEHAFVWQDGVMIGLGTLGGDHSTAFTLNERGQIVGQSTTAQGEMHATLWTLRGGNVPLPGTGMASRGAGWLLLVPVLVGAGMVLRRSGRWQSGMSLEHRHALHHSLIDAALRRGPVERPPI